MRIADKIVTTIPLEILWTNESLLLAKRISYLTSEDIIQLLQKSALQFVVADVGHKLKWIDINQCFDFWKKEVKQHIVNNTDRIDIESITGSYAYVASLWTGQEEMPIVALEMIH